MKHLIITALLLISISAYSQEQEIKRPLKDSIWLTDQTFIEIANRIGNATKLINNSSIAVKDAKPVTEALDNIIFVLNNQMLAKSKEEKQKSSK